ncbi:uncharacterized protein MONOS_15697 [Monocercomonoides exilis]|uniref:uncharacterized protein n=1 Tax=Monocercomonoides exilis TaxID=2049356 RepID=UPI00355A6BB7|nr:hypothetical protein MONOS_15697 [Monocercomonoides exilis]|eukprot:MONOS_15697.1-p1 / transcript=MONOS_15697.1 / gene=MONOS_15697 / organism=Monocercomonoides_exilis_PA203 / gene_product=unspecified product / transcript_product=unspecified product / location=Mono_scaffold01316:3568-5023(+) / protein_length=430 / sequence_SO=supercontig / SO=protein_coding / is_pseudo=false
MEDVVQSHAAIALAVLEEREEAEEGERGGKEGEEKVVEDGVEDGGREEGEGDEMKGGYSAVHREFVERIKENQGKLEEAMTPLVVEALGLSRLRFAKAGAGTEADAEASADAAFGATRNGSAEEVGKDVEQVEMSKSGLEMNEESGREGGLIDLEKEEEEEEEEGQILDVESLLSVPAHPECVTLVDESAYGSWRDYLVTMTVTGVLVELCAERERIVWKPVVEGMIQPDGTMSITFIGESQIQKEKRREEKWGGSECLASDWALFHFNKDRQRETMNEFVVIEAVVPQESVPSIALRDATFAIGQVCQWKGMIEVFGFRIASRSNLETTSFRAAPALPLCMCVLRRLILRILTLLGLMDLRAECTGWLCSARCSSRVSPQPVPGWATVSAQAYAFLSPISERSFVKEQPFYHPELKRVPRGQFFSNCR